ncbi:MAG: peptidylprolyl isomerase [Planctomycetota bacterium]
MRFLLALMLAVIVVAGCDAKPAEDPTTAAKKFPTPDDPAIRKTAPETFQVKFATSAGDVVLEVHRPWAPIGVDRFYNLVVNGFYDDTRIFRVEPATAKYHVVQWGVSGDPAISREWFTATIRDDPVRQMNMEGLVSFAKSPTPHTRTTQIFVNLRDHPSLDMRGFAPIGKITQGLDILKGLTPTTPENDHLGRVPDQNKIAGVGNQYLDPNFPKLCRILTAKVIP